MNGKQLYTAPRLIVHGDVVNITSQIDDDDLGFGSGDRRRRTNRRSSISSAIGSSKRRDFNIFD